MTDRTRTSTRTPPTLCVQCGYFFNAAAEVKAEGVPPHAGAIGVCVNCGHAGIYQADLTIREMTQAERDSLAPETHRQLAMARVFASRNMGHDLARQGGRT